MVAFLAVFVILLLVLQQFLRPAYEALNQATPPQKRQLTAYPLLLLAIVLFILFVTLILSFRIWRFFLPPPTTKPTKTKYVDAWSESGKRLPTPPPDDQETG